MADQERQVLQQRQLHRDEPEAERGEVDDRSRRRVRRSRRAACRTRRTPRAGRPPARRAPSALPASARACRSAARSRNKTDCRRTRRWRARARRRRTRRASSCRPAARRTGRSVCRPGRMMGCASLHSMIRAVSAVGERPLAEHEDHLRLVVRVALAPLDERDDALRRFVRAEQRHRVRHQSRNVHVPAQNHQHAVVGEPIVVPAKRLGRVEVVLRERQAAGGDRRPRIDEAQKDDVEAVGPCG